MVSSAAQLIGVHGVAGTTIHRVLAHSHGPRGSVTHHFPGGRDDIVAEALTQVGDRVAGLLRAAAAAGTPARAVFEGLCDHYRGALVDSGFRAGCPVGTAAQEVFADDRLGSLVAGIVASWQQVLADALRGDGHDRARADQLAVLAVSALEGAITVARVQRSAAPVDAVRELVAPLLTRS